MFVKFSQLASVRVVPYSQLREAVSKRSAIDVPVDKKYLYFVTEGIHADEPNDNGDMFPESELFGISPFGGRVSETWVEKPVLENHNQSRKLGKIVDTHEVMERKSIDMLDTIDREKHPLLAKDIEDGKIRDTSMGVLVEKGVCSVCGNEAHSESDWCWHLRYFKGRRDEETGKLIYEINYGLTGLEDSVITQGRGADPFSKVREVLASSQGCTDEEIDKLIFEEYKKFCKGSLGVKPDEFLIYLLEKIGLKVN